MWPNPVRSHFNIENVSSNEQVKVLNSLGQSVVVPMQRTNSTVTLNMESLRTGVYFVEVKGTTKRVVKLN